MSDKKLRTAAVLMTSSILLLVILQVYWLRNAWYGEYHRLKREVSVTLRETVMQRQMEEFTRLHETDTAKSDLPVIQWKPIPPADDNTINARGKVNILMDKTGDSGRRRPVSRMFRFDSDQHNDDIENTTNLTVQFPSLLRNIHLDTIAARYRKALADAGISLSFVLQRHSGDTAGRFFRAEIKIDSGDKRSQVSRNLGSDMIEADFENPFFLLLSKILWQLFFAIVMIAITATAFIFLYRNLRMQQRLADLKNDFIANITHELKTPIATVGVAIEALKNFDAMHDAARTKEYLDISGNELQRLNLLVDKVLRLSMLGEHEIELQQERIDMKKLIREVMNSMKLQFEKQDAMIHFETSGDDFTTVGDRLHLLSVLYNLLDNALKYSPKDPRIDISIQALEKQLVIKIADNGIGIASEHRHKVFDKFFRVPHGNTHNIKGYGLGLSYAQEVLLTHGGSIDVKSEEGKGSVFTVTLKKMSGEL